MQEIEQAARKKDVSHIQPRRREERSRRIQREKHDDGPAANEQVGVSIQNIIRTTLIISKKPGNTGISRDIRTEFTTDLLLSD